MIWTVVNYPHGFVYSSFALLRAAIRCDHAVSHLVEPLGVNPSDPTINS